MTAFLCEVTWSDTGNSFVFPSSTYEYLYDCLYDNFTLSDLTDIHSIYFNGYFSLIEEFDYNFDCKVMQLIRLCDYFEDHKYVADIDLTY